MRMQALGGGELAEAARRIADAERILVLTGAGVSAESGVPTFRGPEGLWRSHRPEQLATPVVGASSVVSPAAAIAPAARARGAFVVEVNPHETPLTPLAHASFRGPAGAILPSLVAAA